MKTPALLMTLLVLAELSPLQAAELVARGLSFPFFNEAGKLTHKISARHGAMTGGVQRLREVEIEYYAAGDPSRIMQRVTANEATWHEKAEVLEGAGAVTVETEENRITGEGFRFELPRSQLLIHRDFTMTNREVRLTSDRAVVDLVLQRDEDDVKLRDVKRCEAIGNLHVRVLPTAAKKYDFDELRSERAVYDGAAHIIYFPEPSKAWNRDRTLNLTYSEIKLDPKSRPAERLGSDRPKAAENQGTR